MLFFQAALLGGYLYAHLTTRWLGVRKQAGLHLLLLAAAGLLLPVSLAGAEPEGGGEPVAWLLWTMLTTVGPPFLVLSGAGPILQRWFSSTSHRDAADPCRLYAASNLGGGLACLADQHDLRYQLAQRLLLAAHLLGERDMRAAHLGAGGDDLEQIVDAGRAQIVDLQPAYDEKRRCAAIARRVQLRVVHAEQAQEVGAAALAPAQIVGVVDEAGEIGVLEIDADRQDVPTPLNPPGQIRPALRPRHHRRPAAGRT
jgi:hypothetical protein